MCNSVFEFLSSSSFIFITTVVQLPISINLLVIDSCNKQIDSRHSTFGCDQFISNLFICNSQFIQCVEFILFKFLTLLSGFVE